jgi:predicted nucleotidyltransferase
MAGGPNSQEHLTTISELYRAALEFNAGIPMAMVLIGSVARGTATHRSDVDLLFLTNETAKAPSAPSKFHIHLFTRERFLRKLAEGDDFAAWAVRFGVPIEDHGIWTEITKSPEAQVWPEWRKKVKHSVRRLILGARLLEIGDQDAASEELLFAIGHAARALLLRGNVFPLSRAELITQTKEIGYAHLSSLLDRLIFGDPDPEMLLRAKLYSKKLLCYLDQEVYRESASEVTRKSKQKATVSAERLRGSASPASKN